MLNKTDTNEKARKPFVHKALRNLLTKKNGRGGKSHPLTQL